MTSRLAIVALAVTATLLSGCSGQPAPEATTPAFTSDAQAFAAAEQTYRNYVDALNHVDLSDPKTFEAVYAWTTGEQNSNDRRGLSTDHANRVTVTGGSAVLLGAPRPSPVSSPEIAVCLDVSAVQVTDSNGASMVDPNRVNIQSLTVVLEHSGKSPTGALVSIVKGREGDPKCTR